MLVCTKLCFHSWAHQLQSQISHRPINIDFLTFSVSFFLHYQHLLCYFACHSLWKYIHSQTHSHNAPIKLPLCLAACLCFSANDLLTCLLNCAPILNVVLQILFHFTSTAATLASLTILILSSLPQFFIAIFSAWNLCCLRYGAIKLTYKHLL